VATRFKSSLVTDEMSRLTIELTFPRRRLRCYTIWSCGHWLPVKCGCLTTTYKQL